MLQCDAKRKTNGTHLDRNIDEKKEKFCHWKEKNEKLKSGEMK